MLSDEPLLAVEEIQGNILAGFNKTRQYLLGLSIQQGHAAKVWLREVADAITTLGEVHAYKKKHLRGVGRTGRRVPPTAWTNIAFSWPGIMKLVPGTPPGGFDGAFVQGQWRRSMSHLGDPIDPDVPGSPSNWKVGGSEDTTPDIFLIVAADTDAGLEDETAKIISTLPRQGLSLSYKEKGQDLPEELGLSGHEHFGFKDNLSRPRARGLVSLSPLEPLEPRQLGGYQNPALPEYAAPGQPLVWPGQFVLGYETQSATDPRCSKPSFGLAPSWLKDGSYLVFRRLYQDVALFRQFVSCQAQDLSGRLGLNISEEKFAAMMVGRWKSGAPLELTPEQDDPRCALPELANDFLYLGASNRQPNPLPPDIDGSRCPISAHIRKANPRDQGTDLGPPADTLRRQILRRGIPYGCPLPEGVENAPEIAAADRGLLFLCYHSSIVDSFETITRTWINSTAGPTPQPAFDLLLGRNPAHGRERFGIVRAGGVDAKVTALAPFVYATGGGYFFSPSLSAIRHVLSV